MMTWKGVLKADPTDWLLEPENPSVRYRTLTELLNRPQDDPEVIAARAAITTSKPVSQILAAQYPEGYWIKPDRGYSPKYKATVWQVMFLADLAVSPSESIARACEYVLDNSRLDDGRFTAHKYARTGAIVCLNGNLVRALIHFGYGDDPRLGEALDGLVALIEERAFQCHYNHHLACAWGAIKALSAFAALPPAHRTPAIEAAIGRGVDFLLSYDLAEADYPNEWGVSPLWFRFGFPLGYTSDILEALEVLTALGIRDHPRLEPAMDLVLGKQDEQGRWPLEYTPGKMWTSFGKKGEPSKWVTLRALRVLKRVGNKGRS
ncbi:MAG: nitrogen fixation protein NifH [Anaerolineae bacterium]